MVDIGKFIGKDIANLNKVLGVDVSTLAKLYGFDLPSGSVIPAGLIVPFNNAGAAPSGWTLFTGANGKLIIGAGGALSVGATGGSNSGAISVSAASNHTGTVTAQGQFSSGGSGQAITTVIPSRGTHSHTGTFSLTPPERYTQLIKANTDLIVLPGDSFSFADQVISGITQYFSGEYNLFGSAAAIGTQGSWTPSNIATSAAGSHVHGTQGSYVYDDKALGNLVLFYQFAGYHSHTLTGQAATNLIKRTRMTAWGSGSEFVLQPGMVFLYEYTTGLPAGWALCDGTGDTPDLRDRLLDLGTTGDHGTLQGNGTVTFNWSVNNHGFHMHRYGYNQTWDSGENQYHQTTGNAHTNNHGTSHNIGFTPPYYALAYIMYTG